jgi:hypothetical protein
MSGKASSVSASFSLVAYMNLCLASPVNQQTNPMCTVIYLTLLLLLLFMVVFYVLFSIRLTNRNRATVQPNDVVERETLLIG